MNSAATDRPSQNEEASLSGATDCWRRCRATRAAALIDGSNYYGALRSSLMRAQRRVFLVGWDIDSRTPIRGEGRPEDDAPETLGPLLTCLVERNPDLEVYILLWDFSVLYAGEREPLPKLNLGWRTPDRVHVCLDDELPIGASHHEKLVVVDDAVAFCGGLDLTIRRWDTPAHDPGHPDRADPGGTPYEPFHDLQMIVDGEAARALADLVRNRWRAVQDTPVPEPEPVGDPWPEGLAADCSDLEIAIVRTKAEHDGEPGLKQVETAYLRAIESAERLVYIENQYLTAPVIANALRQRLQVCRELEVLIISPKTPGGWLEAQTMGMGRQYFLEQITAAEVRERVGVFYPWVVGDGQRHDIMVHSKLMIVDDDRLQIGSANLCRRSMGVDTECDLVAEAQSDGQRAAIARLRRRLLAEHLGTTVQHLEAQERHRGSVIDAVGSIEPDARGLAPLEDWRLADEPWTESLMELADPERPIDAAEFVGDLFGARSVRPLLRRTITLMSLAAAVSLLLAIWRYTPLAEWTDPDRLEPMLAGLSSSPWVGPIILGAFLAGSLVVFPVTILVAATAIALGPWSGFFWAFSGCLLGASATFGLGRLLGRQTLAGLLGRWVGKISPRLRHGGIVPVAVIRNIPVAPFTVVNVVAGATAIRFRDYLMGTALGMAPGVAALTILGDRLRSVWEQPSLANVGLLSLALALWIGVALGLQALSNRVGRR